MSGKKEEYSSESKKNQIFVLLGFLFILVAVSFLAFTVFTRWKSSVVLVASHFSPIIFTDQDKFLEIGGMQKDQISKTISDEVNATDVKSGAIEAIYLTNNKKVVGFRELLTTIEANVDQTQLAFLDDNFLLGASNQDTKNLFILLKMRSVQDVFAGMHSWEDKMFYDLHGFFGVEVNPDTKYLLTKNFEDGIVKNKNARILYDNDGKIVMTYAYVNDTSVVVTNSETTTDEIITRLAASQVKK